MIWAEILYLCEECVLSVLTAIKSTHLFCLHHFLKTKVVTGSGTLQKSYLCCSSCCSMPYLHKNGYWDDLSVGPSVPSICNAVMLRIIQVLIFNYLLRVSCKALCSSWFIARRQQKKQNNYYLNNLLKMMRV